MNNLIAVIGETQQVNARELHAALGVGRDFSNWIKDRIEKYGFIDGQDYSPNLADRSDGLPGKPRSDYLLTLSMAKEIAMVENNDQGRQIRQYLIKLEQAWNTPEMILSRAQQVAQRLIDNQRAMITGLTQEKESLQIELSCAQEWYTVKRVLIETGKNYPWKQLKEYSLQNGYEIKQAFDQNYEHVNSYHIDVWHAVYGLEL
ncbi:antA/AntB antirepressor family protein [Treponema primitia]|uniref:antA/AntB antirepressor family protein n=1 Tax=Treponema primitia TaxID=88058 RepID=UPI0039810193